jgi:MFS family permease
MSRFVPWLLVALCFALGVASRSIGDTFVVFVPALQSAFDASRSSITLVYSFALLVGGIGALAAGWIVDRFGLAALTAAGMSPRRWLGVGRATEIWHSISASHRQGFANASLGGVLSSSVVAAISCAPACDGGRLVGGRHHVPARRAP